MRNLKINSLASIEFQNLFKVKAFGGIYIVKTSLKLAEYEFVYLNGRW